MKTLSQLLKQIQEEKQDPMITGRQKVDAKHLVPTRASSKGGSGGDGGSGGGGDGGGGGGGGSLEEDTIEEGNPLSRMTKQDEEGRHSIIMSAERHNLTPKENRARMNTLKNQWRERGYGFRKTEGKWDEGGGVGKENSLHVYAKSSSKEHSAELLKHAKELSKHHDQDAFIHRSPKGTGTAVYTGTEKKGEKVTYGKTAYNKDNPYGETQYKKSKPEGQRPKFTFKE